MAEKNKTEKSIMLSAIQPTSVPHLGNYLGAIRNWVNMQNNYQCYFFAVDLHALTVPRDPLDLRMRTYEVIAYYLASGLDPEQAVIFCQSHVPEHAELAWILNCFTYMGELSRMTQFKDKSQKQGTNIGAGLFNYPVLMAADILLYKPRYIPVGHDQKQHVELARDLAERMNNRFSKEIFVIPEPIIGESSARVMDLQDPISKMSKSSVHPKGVLFLNDSDKDIAKKIKSAVTDSGSEIVYSDEKKGLKNLIEINATLSGKTPDQVVLEYSGKMYGHLKMDTAELAVSVIGPIRDTAQKLMEDLAYLNSLLQKGAQKAQEKASQTLTEVYESVGLLPKPRFK